MCSWSKPRRRQCSSARRVCGPKSQATRARTPWNERKLQGMEKKLDREERRSDIRNGDEILANLEAKQKRFEMESRGIRSAKANRKSTKQVLHYAGIQVLFRGGCRGVTVYGYTGDVPPCTRSHVAPSVAPSVASSGAPSGAPSGAQEWSPQWSSRVRVGRRVLLPPLRTPEVSSSCRLALPHVFSRNVVLMFSRSHATNHHVGTTCTTCTP